MSSKMPFNRNCAFALLLGCAIAATLSAATVANLKTEYCSGPLGIDVTKPRLSWTMQSGVRGDRQTAYRIIAASTLANCDAGTGDLWDSGKLLSDESINITYKGQSLTSRRSVFWKVMAWDKDGVASPWSEKAQWSMGLLNDADWGGASWIGPAALTGTYAAGTCPAIYLRKEFAVAKAVRSATVTISGLGLYELFINGNKIGDYAMAPAFSNTYRDIHYNTFYVTSNLNSSNNAVGIILGNGYYFALREGSSSIRGYPRVRMNLRIDYADGTTADIVTDNTWKLTNDGPEQENNEYDGEKYDARKEIPGWNKTGFNDASWRPASAVAAPGGALRAQMIEPKRWTQVLPAVTVTNPAPGIYEIDFGQAFYGTTRIKNIPANTAGTKITMTQGYRLDGKGRLVAADNRSALSTDTYITKGTGNESWTPIFRGQGRRYIELQGFPGSPTTANFESMVIENDMEKTGDFSCSNALINRIYSNVRWTSRAIKRDYPIDPDRDERQPWAGDPAKDALSDHYLFLERSFYANWINEFMHEQQGDGQLPDIGPGIGWIPYYNDITWPSVVTIIPDDLFNFYGDTETVRHNYSGIRAWMEKIKSFQQPDKTFAVTQDQYGDWCDVTLMDRGGYGPGLTDRTLIATAYYCNNCKIMARFARILGNASDVTYFNNQQKEIKAGFNGRFFDSTTCKYSTETQFSYILPLEFGLVPDAKRDRVIANLLYDINENNGGHLTVGLTGMQWMMQTLTKIGHPEAAYTIATRTNRPSWGYMIQKGATGTWERWDADTQGPDMNSHLLYILDGGLIAWFYQTLAGIQHDTLAPAFKNTLLKPRPMAGLTSVNCSYKSMHGTIVSTWSITGRTFAWNVTVPSNTTAKVYFPPEYGQDIKENGTPVGQVPGITSAGSENGSPVYTALSGSYSFTSSGAGVDGPLNLALGGTVSASTTAAGYSMNKINDDDRAPYVNPASTPVPSANPPCCSWASDGTALPQWVQIDFGGNKTFNRIELWTTKGYPVKSYQLQYWKGAAWVDAAPAVTGNSNIHRTHHFGTVTGSKVRVLGNSGPDNQPGFVRVNELEVYDDSVPKVGVQNSCPWNSTAGTAASVSLATEAGLNQQVSATSATPANIIQKTPSMSVARDDRPGTATKPAQPIPSGTFASIASPATTGETAPATDRPLSAKQAVMQADKIIRGKATLQGSLKKYGIRIQLSSAATGSQVANTLTDRNGDYTLYVRDTGSYVLNIEPPKKLKDAYGFRRNPVTVKRDTLVVKAVMLDRSVRREQ